MASDELNIQKITPLMEQYNEFKAKYADAILLFRVGDFYETFGSDAVLTSKLLGITLTARNNGSSKIELAGFPYHSLDNYLPKLVKAGYRVAVCDQLEKPSPLKKIVKRGVTELVTPGVTSNDKILDHRSNNYVAAIHLGLKEQAGLSLLDISTGEFWVAEGDYTAMIKLLQQFSASEILYAKSNKSVIQKYIEPHYFIFGIDDWIFSSEYAENKLLQLFEVNSLKGFGIDDLHLAQIAASAILHYVETTENKNLSHISKIQPIQTHQFMWLDRFTIRNLELIHSQYATGTSLLDILDQSSSPMGSRMLKRWILMPLKDIKEINFRQGIVNFFMNHPELALLTEDQIKNIGDIERLIAKVPLGKINPRELVHLAKALDAILEIKKIWSGNSNKDLQELVFRLDPCVEIKENIAKTIQDNAMVKMDKGGFIQNGISAELDELRDLIHNSKDHLLALQQRESEATGIENLKIGFNNVFGYYLEVTNKHKDKAPIPDNWVRKQTLTNAERYITDDLKKLEDKILNAEEKIIQLEQDILFQLINQLGGHILQIQQNAQILAQLDCLLGFMKSALENQYHQPIVDDSFLIDLKEARHPVIEKQLKLGDQFIPNDIYLDQEKQQILMITGPNMSGKSAILRQTALIVIMAQMGSFVPARQARIGIVDKLFTRVGASDNISSGESTFMVEMNETASILNNISPRSLVLLDEIGRGTSTYDGISIAWAIAEYLHNHKESQAKTLFATHYHELNELTNRFHRIQNYHVSTREIGNKVIFLRKLTAGGSEHSFGIHVAKMAGMPREIIAKSTEILHQLELQRSSDAGMQQKIKSIPTQQLSFFHAEPDPLTEKVKEFLQSFDVNRITPIESMLKWMELKQIISKNEDSN